MRSKGARLWLRPAYGREKQQWVIRDGSSSIRLGLGYEQLAEAEERLAEYLADRHNPRGGCRPARQVPIADVVKLYADEKGPSTTRPHETSGRLEKVLGFFGDRKLSEINGALCRAYVKHRGSEQAARRELEDLRAAINYHRKEGQCTEIISIVLPDKAESRDVWLTRQEAARMICAAWRYRETQKGVKTDRASRQHIARFLLVGLYTGSRAGVICSAALTRAIGRGWVDLDNGVFYRNPTGKKVTKKRAPPIRIPDRLLAHMRRWQRKGLSQNAVVEFNKKPVKSVRKAFARVAEDAKLAGVSPHVLRHTAVTWAMQGGGDLWEVAGFFGMTVEVLERVYGHHHPDHGKGVARALGRK
jgi:integrase